MMLTNEQDKKDIAKNIADQAKYARLLVIWTDCDREGEHIGQEIVDAAKKGNAGIQVKRAKFSNVERAYGPSSVLWHFLVLTPPFPAMCCRQPDGLLNWTRNRLMLLRQELNWIFALDTRLRAS